jgi:cysteine desulfurase / selenocysteine lyase
MIYLDNSATSWPKAPPVAQALVNSIQNPVGNVGRSSHEPAIVAAQILYGCRSEVEHFIPHIPLERIIFTRNATESINIALFGALGAGDSVLTSPIEHNAVARPLQVLAKRGILVHTCPSDEFGRIDPTVFRKQLQRLRPSLAVFPAGSNVSGVINPVETMVQDCMAMDIPYVLDAAQAIGEVPRWNFPSNANGAICFSLHKGLLGPAGVGVMALYGDFRPTPLWFGGTGSLSDSVVQPDFLPDCYESGTPAIHAIAGCSAALAYCRTNAKNINENRKSMGDLLYEGLSQFKQLCMVSPASDRLAVISVTTKEGKISSLTEGLFRSGIAVRAGFHCAPLAHERFGTTTKGGAIRFSPGFLTTKEEVYQTIAVVEEILHA